MTIATAAIKPASLDLSGLPKKYSENWTILCVLRSDAQVKFATEFANANADRGTIYWGVAFDKGAKDWLEVNAWDAAWSAGKWPKHADEYLGAAALADARSILAQAA